MTSRSARWRIQGAFVSNALARTIRAAEQFILIPILLALWGAEQYGEWIALISIAAFASIANLGIGHASLSDIVLCYSNGKREQAARSFTTSIVLITGVVVAGYALLIGALFLIDLGSLISLHSLTAADARRVILLAGLAALLTFYIEPLIGVLGSAVGVVVPNVLFSIAKIAELGGIAIAVYLSGGPIAVAAIMLAGTLLNLLMNVVVTVKVAPWIKFKISDFDTSLLKRTWKASLGFFVFWVCANIINVQVSRLIVFHFFGAAALASFVVLLTYTKVARAIPLMMSQAAQVEIGRSFGEGRIAQLRAMVETIIGWAVLVALVLLAIEMLVAPIVIPILTHGKFAVTWDLLAVLALVALAGTYFDATMVTAAALNRVSFVAGVYATTLALGLIAAILLKEWIGLWAIGVALLLPEIGGAFAAIRTLGKIVPPLDIRTFPLPRWPLSAPEDRQSAAG